MEDITERRRAEDKLLKLSRAVDQSPVRVVITDDLGLIEFVNPAFTRTTGYSAEEVIGQNPSLLKSGQTSPETYKKLWSALTFGGRWEGEFLNKSKDGRFFWELCNIYVLFNDRREITHYVASKVDITERKQSEHEALKSRDIIDTAKSRLSLATKVGGVGIWDYDIINDILSWDEQMFCLYGISPDTFSGAYAVWRAGLHPDDIQRCDGAVCFAGRK